MASTPMRRNSAHHLLLEKEKDFDGHHDELDHLTNGRMLDAKKARNEKNFALPTHVSKRRKRSYSWTQRNPVGVFSLIILWYAAATTNTFMNKIIVKKGVPAEMLTTCHYTIGVFFDLILLSAPKRITANKFGKLQPLGLRELFYICPVAGLSVLGKLLTYWSYDMIPVALAHTAKVIS